MCFFLSAMLGLHRCEGLSLVVASRGYSLVAASVLLTPGASLVAERRLEGMGFGSCGCQGLQPQQLWFTDLVEWWHVGLPSPEIEPAHVFCTSRQILYH